VFEKTTFLHPGLGFHLRFPPEWKTENGATYVAGVAPDGKVMVVATVAVTGDDPMDGVRAFEKDIKQPLTARIDRRTLGGLPAAHIGASAESDGRRVAVELFWVALGGRVFQLTGVASARLESEARPLIGAIADTFGTLTPDERAGINERRLRLTTARPAESMTAFTIRTQTPWKPDLVAVVNGLEVGMPLPANRTLKIARTESYRGER
jgi:predicted Zn-dependent protease